MSLQKIALKTVGQCLNLYARLSPKKAGVLGLNLFCLPFSKKLKPYQREFLLDAAYKKLNFNGKQIQIYKWGNGSRKVLLVHGWASHSFRWENYIEELIYKDFSIYAFDAPGHGKSQGKMLTLPMYSEIIHKIVQDIGEIQSIIGHSLGGYAIINWLHHHPQNNDLKTVIMAAPGEVSDFMTMYKQQLGLSVHTSKSIDLEFVQRINKKPSDFSASLLAKDFHYPCLIIHDEEDHDTSVEYSKKLHQVWKDSELHLTQGLGHRLKSNEVIYKVIGFLI